MEVGFNPGTGITGIQTPRTEEMSMPKKAWVSPALAGSQSAPGLETYDGRNLDAIIDQALQPQCSDPDLMRPEVFSRTLERGLEKLCQGTGDEALGQLAQGIAENASLLRTYENLVIPG